jgi:hypothetical protein
VKKIFTTLVLVVLAAGSVFAGEIVFSDAQGSGLKLRSETRSGGNDLTLRMSCAIEKVQFNTVSTPKGEFAVMYTPEFYFGGAYGAPQLPMITKLIQVPLGAKFKVNVKSHDTKEYKLADFGVKSPIFPRQPSAPKNGDKVPFVYEKSAYVARGFNGPALTSIKEVGMLRHMRLAQLAISPIKYDAVSNKIVVYNNVELEVVFENSDLSATRARTHVYSTPAYSFLNEKVVVPQALKATTRNSAKMGYVIVTDPMFKDEVAPFAAHKASKGYQVTVVTTEQFGTGAAIAEPLKKYLHDMYKNPTAELPAPSYVLFVGDHGLIPAFKGTTGTHISDLPYAAVTPGDFLPEFLTGRFSANNVAELKPQIEKTMEYENFAFPDPSFLDDVVLVAGWDASWAKSHGWPHINYFTKYYINAENGFKNVSTFLSAGSHQNEATIVSAVSKGASYVNYTAHGSPTSWADPSFSISQINNLGNKGKYPLVIGNCCITNKFELATCFGEAWLRAKDAGAIGYIGGSNNTYWDEDFWWGVGLHAIVKPNDQGVPPLKEKTGRGAIDAMFAPGSVSNGAFMVIGNLAVEASTSPRKQYYWEIYHLMGDPSLKTYMGNPKK